MSEQIDTGLMAGYRGGPLVSARAMAKARWAAAGLALGLAAGGWTVGGPDRYGEADGIAGGMRGASRTLAKGGRYAAAVARDLVSQQPTSVRGMGLAEQVETRLWQDKRLDAEGIYIEVDRGDAVVLKGIVPDEDHKDMAVALARQTRGVARVVDQLAVSPTSRTIEATPTPPVPTGVALGARVLK